MIKVMKKIISTMLLLFMLIGLFSPLSVSAASHNVTKGDTWISIAKRYNVTAKELAAANGRTTSQYIFVGETLKIPKSSSSSSNSNNSSSNITYRVQKGDTWISIAKRYNITSKELAAANKRTTSQYIFVGETLKIPKSSSSSSSSNSNNSSSNITYRVQKGDTWISIAKRYSITSKELAAANGRSTSQYIFVGETLKIPKRSLSKSSIKYNSVTLKTASTDKNSWYNIKLATSKLNGMVIAPNGRFSWFDVMGPCNSAAGYKIATVYTTSGKVSSSAGGGICMVSTTLMQSARGAGCIITEKYDHSLPVSYATRGNEASVSWKTFDLKFYNPSDKYIRFTCSTDDKAKTCTITCTPIS